MIAYLTLFVLVCSCYHVLASIYVTQYKLYSWCEAGKGTTRSAGNCASFSGKTEYTYAQVQSIKCSSGGVIYLDVQDTACKIFYNPGGWGVPFCLPSYTDSYLLTCSSNVVSLDLYSGGGGSGPTCPGSLVQSNVANSSACLNVVSENMWLPKAGGGSFLSFSCDGNRNVVADASNATCGAATTNLGVSSVCVSGNSDDYLISCVSIK